jgi:hypothetical protein
MLKRLINSLLISALVVLGGSAYAGCGFSSFRDNGDGTATDPESGLVWQKCVEGTKYEGGRCSPFKDTRRAADADTFTWAEAMARARSSRFLGRTDWRLPSPGELFGLTRDCLHVNGKIHDAAYPGPMYREGSAHSLWTFEKCTPRDPPDEIQRRFGPAGFAIGIGNLGKHCQPVNSMPTFLVRSDTPSPEFEANYRDSERFIMAAVQQNQERTRAEQGRLDQERAEVARQKEREQAFAALLNSKDPQIMYLAAGKYEREGESHRAKAVYERIVSRFPSSQFAVKANDQLLFDRRAAEGESSRRQAAAEGQRRAFDACWTRKIACKSSCNSTPCYSRCESIC